MIELPSCMIGPSEPCEAFQEQTREIERLRTSLAEAEGKLDDYLQDYKAFHGVCTMRNLRARAERASTQIAELQEQLHHLYGVEQRAERAERERDGARSQCRADIAAMQREIARADRAEANLAAAREALQRIIAIEHKEFGPDYEEIEEAQEIASAFLERTSTGK